MKEQAETEHRTQGYADRSGAGLPRSNDGSLLLLQHTISKMAVARRSLDHAISDYATSDHATVYKEAKDDADQFQLMLDDILN